MASPFTAPCPLTICTLTNICAGCPRACRRTGMPLLASTVAWLLSPQCLPRQVQGADHETELAGHAELDGVPEQDADRDEEEWEGVLKASDGRGVFIAISPCGVRCLRGTHARTHVHTCLGKPGFPCRRTRAHTHTRMHARTHACMCARNARTHAGKKHMRACASASQASLFSTHGLSAAATAAAHARMHARTRTRARAHTHTHTHTLLPQLPLTSWPSCAPISCP